MSYDTNPLQTQSSDIAILHQAALITPYDPYHQSVCGSILHSTPTNSPAEIFSYLQHGNFDAFHRSIDVYHKDIVQMRNNAGQVNTYTYLFDYIISNIIFRLYYTS
jgi:hypothetical protein